MSYLFDTYFPNRYLMTVKGNTNRHEHFTKQLTLAEVNNVKIIYGKKMFFRNVFKNPVHRGITTTHLQLHRKALSENFGNVLIFEDDIQFATEFKKRIEPVLADLIREDWDIFYFFKPQKGNSDLDGDRGQVIRRYDSGLLKITGTIHTHAYAINKDSLRKLVETYNLNYIKKLHPQIRVIDKSIASLRYNYFAIDQDLITQSLQFESSTKKSPQFSGLIDNLKLYLNPVGNKIIE